MASHPAIPILLQKDVEGKFHARCQRRGRASVLLHVALAYPPPLGRARFGMTAVPVAACKRPSGWKPLRRQRAPALRPRRRPAKVPMAQAALDRTALRGGGEGAARAPAPDRAADLPQRPRPCRAPSPAGCRARPQGLAAGGRPPFSIPLPAGPAPFPLGVPLGGGPRAPPQGSARCFACAPPGGARRGGVGGKPTAAPPRRTGRLPCGCGHRGTRSPRRCRRGGSAAPGERGVEGGWGVLSAPRCWEGGV